MKGWRMSCDVGKATEGLENKLPLLRLRHSSFSNPSFASPKSQALQLIHLASRPCVHDRLDCKILHRGGYRFNEHWLAAAVLMYHFQLMSSAHSPSFPSLHLRHNSFSNPSVALPTSQLILQPFRCFTYVTVHSPKPFFRLSYVTSSSLNSPGEPSMIYM